MDRKIVRNANIEVTSLGFGTSALGSMPDTYGFSVNEDRAKKTLFSILRSPVNLIDTSRNYGMGRSETRIGKVINQEDFLNSDVIISTKLDRDMDTNIFDASRVRQSYEESLKALSLESVPILYLHDPEYVADIESIRGKNGAIAELFRLKEEGRVRAVGLAMGKLDLMHNLLSEWDFDCLITHSRYTLMNRSAEWLIDDSYRKGISIFNAAPFSGGMLAKGSSSFDKYVYQKATPDIIKRVEAYEDICTRYRIPLGVAALQFSMRDPRITSTICGVSKPERVKECVSWSDFPTSQDFWDEILGIDYDVNDPEASRVYRPE